MVNSSQHPPSTCEGNSTPTWYPHQQCQQYVDEGVTRAAHLQEYTQRGQDHCCNEPAQGGGGGAARGQAVAKDISSAGEAEVLQGASGLLAVAQNKVFCALAADSSCSIVQAN
jgi:hypothetical protein